MAKTRPLLPTRPIRPTSSATPGFLNPMNLGALATRPMTMGAPGVPAATPAAPRQATKDGPGSGVPANWLKPSGLPTQTYMAADNVDPGIADRFYGNAPRPGSLGFGMTTQQMVQAGQGGFGGAARPNPNGAAANGGAAVRPGAGAPQQPNMQNGLGQLMQQQTQQRPQQRPSNNVYWPANSIGPASTATASAMIGAQNSAMNNAVGQANNSLVSGPLRSVTGSTGDLQNPGLYTAAYNAAPKAQQTIGAMGDVGDARWNANMGGGGTYTDQGQVIGGGSAGSGTAGNAGTSGSSNAGAGGTSPSAPNAAQQMLDPLVAQFQGAMDAANASNDQRYDQGLGNLAAQRARSEADLARMGQSRAQEIRDNARQQNASVMQNLTARGLANTTNLPTMQRGVNRDAQRSMTQLGDAMATNRYNQDRAMTGDLNQWIYNREDQAPSYDTLANLALGLNQAQVQPPPFDINDVLSRLGRTPSIQDLLSLMPQLQGGQLQQPNMQYPNLPRINFPMQGGAGNDFIAGGPGFVGGGGGLGQLVNRQQPPQNVNLQPPGGGGFAGGGFAGPQGSYGGGGVGEGYYDANGNWVPYMIDQQGLPVSQTQFPATSYAGGTQGNYSGTNADYWNGRV